MAMKKYCAKQGCNELVPMGQRYCAKHQKEYKQRYKQYDNNIRYKRDKKFSEFYHSIEWIKLRQAAIQRDKGLCQECLKRGKVTMYRTVHHIKPIKTHWHLRLSLSNLECVCEKCHKELHKRVGGSQNCLL